MPTECSFTFSRMTDASWRATRFKCPIQCIPDLLKGQRRVRDDRGQTPRPQDRRCRRVSDRGVTRSQIGLRGLRRKADQRTVFPAGLVPTGRRESLRAVVLIPAPCCILQSQGATGCLFEWEFRKATGRALFPPRSLPCPLRFVGAGYFSILFRGHGSVLGCYSSQFCFGFL